MSAVNEAVRVLGRHVETHRRVHTAFVVCICGQWEGHRDQHPIHLAYALDAAGLLAEDAEPAREPVEDRLRALAADMGDTPLTATILRQFADEVAHLRATITPEGK